MARQIESRRVHLVSRAGPKSGLFLFQGLQLCTEHGDMLGLGSGTRHSERRPTDTCKC